MHRRADKKHGEWKDIAGCGGRSSLAGLSTDEAAFARRIARTMAAWAKWVTVVPRGSSFLMALIRAVLLDLLIV